MKHKAQRSKSKPGFWNPAQGLAVTAKLGPISQKGEWNSLQESKLGTKPYCIPATSLLMRNGQWLKNCSSFSSSSTCMLIVQLSEIRDQNIFPDARTETTGEMLEKPALAGVSCKRERSCSGCRGKGEREQGKGSGLQLWVPLGISSVDCTVVCKNQLWLLHSHFLLVALFHVQTNMFFHRYADFEMFGLDSPVEGLQLTQRAYQ